MFFFHSTFRLKWPVMSLLKLLSAKESVADLTDADKATGLMVWRRWHCSFLSHCLCQAAIVFSLITFLTSLNKRGCEFYLLLEFFCFLKFISVF